MKKENMQALFRLADIPILAEYEMMNQYWPRSEQYAKIVMDNPWWAVKTKYGIIVIGWRSKVIDIEWSDTKAREIVTTDEVTKAETLVHAWSEPKALEYLTALKAVLVKMK